MGNGLPDLWECNFSRLYWLHEDIGHTAFAKPLWVGNGLGFSIFESFCGCVGSTVGERVIGATLVATYILGNCWRYFLEQLES